ncbi:MAG: cupredoxin domain-containing protein [Mycolicibacterium aromaticivorans]|nr:cupredoxin domain-containing protein [Mycolicibacterium aromaticivorans]
MTPRIFALSVAIAFAAVLLVAACSAGTKASPSSAPPAAGPTISIADMKFSSPGPVSPGATVTVTNSDGVEHTVTADSGAAFNVEVGEKGTATFTAPSKPGTYPYHCTYHPAMHGQLVVQ